MASTWRSSTSTSQHCWTGTRRRGRKKLPCSSKENICQASTPSFTHTIVSGPRMIFPEPYDMTGSTKANVPKTNGSEDECCQQPLVILPSFMDVDTSQQPPPAETLQRQIKPKPVQPTLFCQNHHNVWLSSSLTHPPSHWKLRQTHLLCRRLLITDVWRKAKQLRERVHTHVSYAKSLGAHSSTTLHIDSLKEKGGVLKRMC